MRPPQLWGTPVPHVGSDGVRVSALPAAPCQVHPQTALGPACSVRPGCVRSLPLCFGKLLVPPWKPKLRSRSLYVSHFLASSRAAWSVFGLFLVLVSIDTWKLWKILVLFPVTEHACVSRRVSVSSAPVVQPFVGAPPPRAPCCQLTTCCPLRAR